MRILTVVACIGAVLAAGPAIASPAVAESGPVGSAAIAPTAMADPPLTIARGQQLGIACACASGSGAEVRVVLALDKAADEAPTGYGKVLATDQHMGKGSVLVTVPDTPDLANHTVRVRVYVVDAKGAHSCDAGTLKIT
jgi:hypothetical protein